MKLTALYNEAFHTSHTSELQTLEHFRTLAPETQDRACELIQRAINRKALDMADLGAASRLFRDRLSHRIARSQVWSEE